MPVRSQTVDSPPMRPVTTPGMPRWLPSPIALFVIVLGVLLYAAFLAKGPWDSDFWWHIRTGQLISEGQFPRTDPFSFTWGGMPWTLHEWLSELLIYRLVDGLGYVGAVLVFAAVPGIAMAILAFGLHRLGLRTAAVAAATSLSAFLVIPYATIRPQALSWIFFAILVVGLLHLRPDRSRWTLLLVPLFVLWANVHLLFWLSLFPFATAWVGETTFASVPVAIYATVFLAAALAYAILVRALVAVPGQNEALAEAVGRDRKGIGSIVAYAVAIPLALVLPLLAVALIVGVAAVWFVPDRRMERALGR